MKKIKILAIAPYEGLKEVLLTEVAARSDIKMDVYVGDLADGAAIAAALENSGYDVILSRGGTATLIEKSVTLPVVDVSPSVFDLLRFIRMAQNIPDRFAVVGFKSITHTARKLFDLTAQKIEVVTLHNRDEADKVIIRLAESGVKLIVGDAIATATAKKNHMNSILIASGRESVREALAQAVRIKGVMDASVSQNLLFRDILEKSELSVIAFDANKKMIFSNLLQDQLEYQRLFRSLYEYIPSVLRDGEFHITRRSKGCLFEITGQKSLQAFGECAVFYIRRRISLPNLKAGMVEYYHMLDLKSEDMSTLPIDNVGQMARVMESAQALSRSSLPVILVAETGTPFHAVLSELYRQSPMNAHPLTVIDCALIDEKSFIGMLDNEDSPFYEARMTLCLKDFSFLSEATRQQFIQYAQNASLLKRNRLIFHLSDPLDPSSATSHFFTELDSLTLRIPPLRERPEDILSLAGLYLSDLNITHGKQVIGFEQEASQLLASYGWPGNHTQLRRLLRQCLLGSSGSILSADTIEAALAEEQSLLGINGVFNEPLSGTLADINARIVQTVLKEEGNNRQKTADRLGISRSTLWRMLKYAD